MTTCKCTQKEHDHSIECNHSCISGIDHDNWICNWCDFEQGIIPDSVREIHRRFTDILKKEGLRTGMNSEDQKVNDELIEKYSKLLDDLATDD